MSKASDLRDQTSVELEALKRDLDKEIFSLKNKLKYSDQSKKTHLISEKKRDRARILTILTEKSKLNSDNI